MLERTLTELDARTRERVQSAATAETLEPPEQQVD
jgi:hypothetical protein